jgi:hypothetical protein
MHWNDVEQKYFFSRTNCEMHWNDEEQKYFFSRTNCEMHWNDEEQKYFFFRTNCEVLSLKFKKIHYTNAHKMPQCEKQTSKAVCSSHVHFLPFTYYIVR